MFLEHKEAGEVTPTLDLEAQLLLEAARFLETNGWLQRSYGWGDGPHCLRGAIIVAGAKRGLNYDEGPRQAIRRVDATFDDTGLGSLIWNDRPGRTAVEVIAKLRAVAFSS